MKKYAVTTTNFEGTVLYGFEENGRLKTVEIDGVHELHAHKQVCMSMPVTETQLLKWPETLKSMKIIEVVDDLSFDNFWTKYNYKVGKDEAISAWNKLSNADKTKAISSIPRYLAHIKDSGIGKAYPQKYLNKKRFNDEY